MVKYDANDYETMKKTIFGEARGEPVEGQIAVAHVILNRAQANRSYWGGSKIDAVCRAPNQFECWNNGDIKVAENESKSFASIDKWLGDVLNGKIADNTRGCDHYNNPKKENAAWVNNVTKVMSIGDHTFYRQ